MNRHTTPRLLAVPTADLVLLLSLTACGGDCGGDTGRVSTANLRSPLVAR